MMAFSSTRSKLRLRPPRERLANIRSIIFKMSNIATYYEK